MCCDHRLDFATYCKIDNNIEGVGKFSRLNRKKGENIRQELQLGFYR